MFDARRGQVYAAGYRVGDGIDELFAPRAGAVEQILDDLDEPGKWCFAGDGAGVGDQAVRAVGGLILPVDTWVPRAGSLLWLASAVPEDGRVTDPGTWEPSYVRLPAAQRDPGV